ncbi:MAG: NUDIX domain-containing protein, partial [Gemmatimonadaceae bacterium]|nr:NUDIX domain-containing protein [Gemmatimonadaceae bacterium]
MPPAAGQWTIPGGYVETDETLSEAIVREVTEETGVICEVESLLSVRSVAFGVRHDTYVAFVLRYLNGDPVADGVENDEAQFVRHAELATFGGLTGFSRTLALAALDGSSG